MPERAFPLQPRLEKCRSRRWVYGPRGEAGITVPPERLPVPSARTVPDCCWQEQRPGLGRGSALPLPPLLVKESKMLPKRCLDLKQTRCLDDGGYGHSAQKCFCWFTWLPKSRQHPFVEPA